MYGQNVQFPGMPMNAQPAPTINIAGAQFPAGGGQALTQPGAVNALANYYRGQPGGPMPGTRPMLPAPGGEGPTSLAPTAQGLGQMSPQVQALMRQYQSNQALQNRLASGVMMQPNASQNANTFAAIMNNPNMTPDQQRAALAQAQAQPQPAGMSPWQTLAQAGYAGQPNPQPAPMQPTGMPAQGAAAMGNLPPGALGLARYYQR